MPMGPNRQDRALFPYGHLTDSLFPAAIWAIGRILNKDIALNPLDCQNTLFVCEFLRAQLFEERAEEIMAMSHCKSMELSQHERFFHIEDIDTIVSSVPSLIEYNPAQTPEENLRVIVDRIELFIIKQKEDLTRRQRIPERELIICQQITQILRNSL